MIEIRIKVTTLLYSGLCFGHIHMGITSRLRLTRYEVKSRRYFGVSKLTLTALAIRPIQMRTFKN